MGGLGSLNIWFYCLSARLAQTVQWKTPCSKVPWIKLEAASILPYHLTGLMWSKTIYFRDLVQLNTPVVQSLKLCSLYKQKYHLISESPPGASFLRESTFVASFPNPDGFECGFLIH